MMNTRYLPSVGSQVDAWGAEEKTAEKVEARVTEEEHERAQSCWGENQRKTQRLDSNPKENLSLVRMMLEERKARVSRPQDPPYWTWDVWHGFAEWSSYETHVQQLTSNAKALAPLLRAPWALVAQALGLEPQSKIQKAIRYSCMQALPTRDTESAKLKRT